MTATTLPEGAIWAVLNGREFPTLGQRVIDFIEGHCVNTKDRWRGRPFRLMGWQKKFLYELFEIDPEAGLRRYRWAYVEVPKKNGKTELIAAIVLYLLIADDEESPEIACGSNSEEQADLVFGAAKAMCELSATLRPLVHTFRREIVLKENPAAKLTRVAAKAKTNDGKNLSTVALDELHEFDESGEQLFNVLTNGVATRRQPLVLMITTAGWDIETLCGRMHEHAKKLIAGEVVDPAFYAKIYAAPVEDINLQDDAALQSALAAANPSYGVTVEWPFYADQRRKGAANFKRYYLDIWTRAESQWLPDGAWEECKAEGWDFDPALPVYVGFDASTRRDSTAIVLTQRDANGLISVRGKAWERPIEPATGKPQENWRVPKEAIKEYLRELCAIWDVREVAYDPWSFAWTADELEAEGIPMVEVPQVPSRLAPATQGLYELIVDHQLRHDGDPTFARHIRNAIPKKVDRGYILDKFRGRANDLAAALVTVIYELLHQEEPEEETYPSIRFFDDDDEVA